MAAMAIVRSQSAAGKHYEIMLKKTAPDRGMIRIKSWRTGEDPERSAPAKQDSLQALQDQATLGLDDRLQG